MTPRIFMLLSLSLAAASCLSNGLQRKQTQECGPELSKEQILTAAQRWVSAVAPGQSVSELHPSIKKSGCQYVVIIPNTGTRAVDDVTIIVDRRGRIRNLPICCELGDCPEWCSSKER